MKPRQPPPNALRVRLRHALARHPIRLPSARPRLPLRQVRQPRLVVHRRQVAHSQANHLRFHVPLTRVKPPRLRLLG